MSEDFVVEDAEILGMKKKRNKEIAEKWNPALQIATFNLEQLREFQTREKHQAELIQSSLAFDAQSLRFIKAHVTELHAIIILAKLQMQKLPEFEKLCARWYDQNDIENRKGHLDTGWRIGECEFAAIDVTVQPDLRWLEDAKRFRSEKQGNPEYPHMLVAKYKIQKATPDLILILHRLPRDELNDYDTYNGYWWTSKKTILDTGLSPIRIRAIDQDCYKVPWRLWSRGLESLVETLKNEAEKRGLLKVPNSESRNSEI